MKEQKIGGTNSWKKVQSIGSEIGIRKVASNIIKDIWPKGGLYLNKYKENWKKTS
jgi:hypothetical protein